MEINVLYTAAYVRSAVYTNKKVDGVTTKFQESGT